MNGRTWSTYGRSLAAALALTIAAMLVAACTSGEAQPVPGDASPTTTQPGAIVNATVTGAPTPAATSEPRRTPNSSGTAVKLVAARTDLKITDGGLSLGGTDFAAEEIYFITVNSSGDAHRLTVAHLDGDPAQLSVDPGTDRVDVGNSVVQVLPAIEPGNTEVWEIEPIAPGDYIIFCNEAGHYRAGEYAAFHISAPPQGTTP